MHYLIDGYNYVHRAGLSRKGSLEQQRLLLSRRLRSLTAGRHEVSIIWDARGAARSQRDYAPPPGPVRSVFARTETADEAILDRVRWHEDARRLCVVSDDREVTGRARQLGARVMQVGELENRLRRTNSTSPTRQSPEADDPGHEKPKPPGKAGLAEWRDYFGEDYFAQELSGEP